MEANYLKPIPVPTAETQPYWDATKQHELRIQRCKNCGQFRHYPQPMCPNCYSTDVEWAKVSGKGKIFTWLITNRAFHPGFANEVPYATVVVELDEGVRMISKMVDTKIEELEIGMPVEVVFEDITPEITLPMFKKAE
jgi:uncharacterized OB-fold protein